MTGSDVVTLLRDCVEKHKSVPGPSDAIILIPDSQDPLTADLAHQNRADSPLETVPVPAPENHAPANKERARRQNLLDLAYDTITPASFYGEFLLTPARPSANSQTRAREVPVR